MIAVGADGVDKNNKVELYSTSNTWSNEANFPYGAEYTHNFISNFHCYNEYSVKRHIIQSTLSSLLEVRFTFSVVTTLAIPRLRHRHKLHLSAQFRKNGKR